MPAPSGLPLHLLLVWLHSSSSSPSALSILSVKGKSLMCYLFWVVLRSKSLELFDCNIPLFSENSSYPSRIYALWNEKGLYENIFNEQRKLWCNHWQLFSKVTARSSGKGEVEIGAFSEAPGGACRIWPKVHVRMGERMWRDLHIEQRVAMVVGEARDSEEHCAI